MTLATSKHDVGGKSRLAWPADSTVTALFSECQQYRYQLLEVWDKNKPLVLWLLMNPCVARTEFIDPTLRKRGKFSRFWDYGELLVGNVHAYHATDKNWLLEVVDPVGPENDRMMLEMTNQAQIIVLAYGPPPKALRQQGAAVVALLSHHEGISHLELAKDGTPKHFLYLPDHLRPQPHRLIAKEKKHV